MKKTFLIIALFSLLSIIFIPFISDAQNGLVPCNGPDCTINSFFQMLLNIYNFLTTMIATPLAIIALIVGGIFMMVSAGNPSTFGKGKEIITWAIIGLFLVWGSYIIINFILTTLGYTGAWSIL
jgi:type IV secretory pathway VirB2 component (pilin)